MREIETIALVVRIAEQTWTAHKIAFGGVSWDAADDDAKKTQMRRVEFQLATSLPHLPDDSREEALFKFVVELLRPAEEFKCTALHAAATTS